MNQTPTQLNLFPASGVDDRTLLAARRTAIMLFVSAWKIARGVVHRIKTRVRQFRLDFSRAARRRAAAVRIKARLDPVAAATWLAENERKLKGTWGQHPTRDQIAVVKHPRKKGEGYLQNSLTSTGDDAGVQMDPTALGAAVESINPLDVVLADESDATADDDMDGDAADAWLRKRDPLWANSKRTAERRRHDQREEDMAIARSATRCAQLVGAITGLNGPLARPAPAYAQRKAAG